MDLDELRVAPGESPHLDKRTTRNGQGLDDKEQAKAELVQTVARLSELQGRLWAEKRRSVLLVLQALDGGGKDGTIRSVFSGVNPQGVEVVPRVGQEGQLLQRIVDPQDRGLGVDLDAHKERALDGRGSRVR